VAAKPQFTIVSGFDVIIDCDMPDPNTGLAYCTCDLDNIEPLEIPLIGVSCISGFSGCAGGEIDCDGGTPLGIVSVGDHLIGDCGLWDDPNETDPNSLSGPSECATLCETYCPTEVGSGFHMFESSCEGYCQAGPREGLRCSADPDCPDGSCYGGEPVAHGQQCNCLCIDIGGATSSPGGFNCETGVSVELEMNEPCDALDSVLVFGSQCVPLTNGLAESELWHADAFPEGSIPSPPRMGVATSCAALQFDDATGAVLVGNMLFWDTLIGDMVVAMTLSCR
jgi:hypothetical protein